MNIQSKTPETLSELVHDLWDIRKPIIIGLAVGIVIAFLYIMLAQKTYKVSMIVGAVPAISTQTTIDSKNLSPLAPQKDGSATLSQMNQSMYRAIFRSPRVANMITKLPDQIKAISYDKKYGLFSYDPKGWSNKDLSNYFMEKIHITPVQSTSDLLEISYSHPNPDFARSFLLQLHAYTDESIRNDHKKLINDRRAYITKALGEAFNIDHKKALGYLLIDLEREAIMVNSDRSFSMRIINNPSSSSNYTNPKSKITLLVFAFVGAFIGAIIGFTKRAW